MARCRDRRWRYENFKFDNTNSLAKDELRSWVTRRAEVERYLLVAQLKHRWWTTHMETINTATPPTRNRSAPTTSVYLENDVVSGRSYRERDLQASSCCISPQAIRTSSCQVLPFAGPATVLDAVTPVPKIAPSLPPFAYCSPSGDET